VCQRVEALAYVHDIADLAGKHQQACQWFDQCMARLQSLGPGNGLPAD
jgi:predicted RecB family nuclease